MEYVRESAGESELYSDKHIDKHMANGSHFIV